MLSTIAKLRRPLVHARTIARASLSSLILPIQHHQVTCSTRQYYPLIARRWQSDQVAQETKPKPPKDDEIAKQFWKALQEKNYTLEAHSITLHGNAFWPIEYDEQTLYFRDCDIQLFDKILEDIAIGTKAFVVTGNPGIGKSWFLMYCLFRWATTPGGQKRPIRYVDLNDPSTDFLFMPNGEVIFGQKEIGEEFILYDIRNRSGYRHVSWHKLKRTGAILIMAASPFQEYFKRLLKDLDGERYFKPVFSREELHHFAEKTGKLRKYPKHKIDEQYFKFGGIPRHVFSLTKHAETQQNEALGRATYDSLLSSTNVDHYLRDGTLYSLFKVNVDEDFRSTHLSLISDAVKQQAIPILQATRERDRTNMIDALLGHPLSQGLGGNAFEPFVFDAIAKGGTFDLHSIDNSSRKVIYGQSERITIKPIPNNAFLHSDHSITKPDFCTMLKEQRPRLWKPNASNHPVIDGMLLHNGKYVGIQVAVGNSAHSFDWQKIMVFLSTFEGPYEQWFIKRSTDENTVFNFTETESDRDKDITEGKSNEDKVNKTGQEAEKNKINKPKQ